MTHTRETYTHTNRPVRSFAMRAGVALGLFTVLVFVSIFGITLFLAERGAREQAASYLDLIVSTRAWNAMHGGAWVVKSDSARSNPYLRELGVEPDTSTVSGTMLTLRNPAAMTNEISAIAEQREGVQFRLTSLMPVNPANAPDSWEEEALRRFESDRSDITQTVDRQDGRALRTIRPLVVDRTCLPCHERQGYAVGDVRGGISVTLPLAATDRAVMDGGVALLGIFLVVLAVSTVAGWRLVSRMAEQIDSSERELHELATTDALTGIANRRAIIERLEHELSRSERTETATGVIELDADHFKHVNDTYGHAAGDVVLRAIAARASSTLREYDAIGRLGGEEFLIVAPDVDEASLTGLADRVRRAVGATPVAVGDRAISVAISVGATLAHAGDTAEAAMVRADTALYAAKDRGRDQVVVG